MQDKQDIISNIIDNIRAEVMPQVGDVIQTANRNPVKNVDDFVKTIEKAKGGGLQE
ncbi:MAG: hypothetical protein ACYDH8_16405 [Syntrophales bacterium]